jgi:hypothetical protein
MVVSEGCLALLVYWTKIYRKPQIRGLLELKKIKIGYQKKPYK